MQKQITRLDGTILDIKTYDASYLDIEGCCIQLLIIRITDGIYEINGACEESLTIFEEIRAMWHLVL